MDTSSIAYNYAIVKELFKSDNIISIDSEVTKLILLEIDLVKTHYLSKFPTSSNIDVLNHIIDVFFKNTINEMGQLGKPLIFNQIKKGNRISRDYVPVKTLDELTDRFILDLNIREKMTMLKNFKSQTNDCIMFSIILEYHKNNDDFIKKYPSMNVTFIDETINLIERILGFNITEVNKCYNNLSGDNEIMVSGCKPLYETMQKEILDPKTKRFSSPITLCWLWHPLIYGIPYQDVIKLPSENYIKNMSDSFVKTKFNTQCMVDTFINYPIFPELSGREKKYIYQTLGNESRIDYRGINLQRLPWSPPICFMKPKTPNSFYINLQKRHNKYFVSNISGHVMIFIIMARFFKNIDINKIILASILYLVPYNHSIHEIFQAVKMMNIPISYKIENNDLNNLNNFLLECNMPVINKELVLQTYNYTISKIPSKRISKVKTGGKQKFKKSKKSKTCKNNMISKRKHNTRKKFI